jgi:hypothetical protein
MLADFIDRDVEELKTLFVAEILVNEVHKYKCSDKVFAIAEEQSMCVKSKNVKQGKLDLK